MQAESPLSGAPITVAVSGATGLIGSALVTRLRQRGHVVKRLVRATRPLAPDDIRWDPARGELDAGALEGVQAIVNLAGEPIAKRWTQARRAAIRDSRVQATTLLARTVAAMAPRPALISGSAVGYYGDRGDEWLDETSTAGRGFLAEVCMDWERATEPAVRAGARVVLLRTGVVMARDGGALAKLLPPFRMGFGGPLGDGRQWTSWIVLEDVLRAIELALQTNALHGPMNLVAPNPVTNAELTSVLGRVLARPALLPVPRVALQLLYGEMADAAILASQRVAPRALAAAGFTFSHPTLEQALRSILER